MHAEVPALRRDEDAVGHYLGVMGMSTLSLAQVAASGMTLTTLSDAALVLIALALLALVLVVPVRVPAVQPSPRAT